MGGLGFCLFSIAHGAEPRLIGAAEACESLQAIGEAAGYLIYPSPFD